MNTVRSPRHPSFRLLLAALGLIGPALSADAALGLYDAFDYGPTSDSPLWTENRGGAGTVEYNGASVVLQQPSGTVNSLAAVQAPNLTQKFLKIGSTFRLTFDLTILDEGEPTGIYGFGLINTKLYPDILAGIRVRSGTFSLVTDGNEVPQPLAISSLPVVPLHLDWEVVATSSSGRLFTSTVRAYEINPSWTSSPDLYRTSGNVYSMVTTNVLSNSNTMELGAFCGIPQFYPDPSTLDRGAMALDNIYVQSAPEPGAAALMVTGALALLGRKRPRRERLEE